MAMRPHRLLVIDDEFDIAVLVKEVAEECGYEVRVTVDANSFKQTYGAFCPDVIVLDLSLPDLDGVQLLRFLADTECTAQLLIISGFDRKVRSAAEQLGEARGLKMVGSIPKPLRIADLRVLLDGLRTAA
jgi:two-component system, OmpR family, response regulator